MLFFIFNRFFFSVPLETIQGQQLEILATFTFDATVRCSFESQALLDNLQSRFVGNIEYDTCISPLMMNNWLFRALQTVESKFCWIQIMPQSLRKSASISKVRQVQLLQIEVVLIAKRLEIYLLILPLHHSDSRMVQWLMTLFLMKIRAFLNV